MSRLVGCRLPWDKWTDPAIPECEETRQLMEHDNWHLNLGELYEREKVVKETGCKVPCSYVKYELANQVKYAIEEYLIYCLKIRFPLILKETRQK